MDMELIEIFHVNDALAEMAALFRVELRSYKGIASRPNWEAGREEMEEYLAAGFPVFAAMVDGKYAGYVVCRVDSGVLWVESLFVRDEYRGKLKPISTSDSSMRIISSIISLSPVDTIKRASGNRNLK